VKEEGAECSFNLPCFSVKPETAKERERERLFFLFFFFSGFLLCPDGWRGKRKWSFYALNQGKKLQEKFCNKRARRRETRERIWRRSCAMI
jgi:hypothetical protein